MVRKTYSRRPRRTTRRLSYTRGARNAYALAKQAAKDIWYLKGLVNSEMLHNSGIGSVNTSSTGTMTLLNGIAQGDTDTERTGKSILMRNVHIRLVFTQNSAATATTYRVMVVKDLQQISDTTPAITDVLESANPLSPLKQSNAGRFKVLKSWLFTTDDDKAQTKIIQYYNDFRFHTRYNGTTATDIQKNGLYLLTICDQATNQPSMAYSWKVGYHDN